MKTRRNCHNTYIMKKSVLIVFASLFFLSQPVWAQFTIDAELRTRGELSHGARALAAPDQEIGFYIGQRTRLNFGYGSKWIDLYVSLQDIRVWGSTPQMTMADGASTWLHQAYGVGKVAKWMDVKVGRQEIILDDSRIFGNVDWAQQARSHDAVLLRFSPDDKTKIWVAGAYNQSAMNLKGNTYLTTNNYKTIQFLWANRKFGKFSASVLFLNNGLQINRSDSASFLGTDTVAGMIKYTNKATYFSQTAGFRVGYDAEKIKVFGAFYYQFGNNGDFKLDSSRTETTGTFDFTRRKMNAMHGSIDVVGIVGPVTLNAGYEYMSGNSQIVPHADDQAFNPFYGTNAKFNGRMDYFYVGNHAKSVGLHDPYFGVKAKYKNFWISATAHYFLAANNVNDPNNLGTAMSSGLGAELDILMGYKFNDELSIDAGYANMFGTTTMEAIRGGSRKENSYWAYLMITFKPKLFNSENYVKKEKEKEM